jgi:hypothetical protein
MFGSIISVIIFVFFFATILFFSFGRPLLLGKDSKHRLADVAGSFGGKMGGSFLGDIFIEVSDYREVMLIELVAEREYKILYQFRPYKRFLWVSWMRTLDFNLSITTPLLKKSSHTDDIIKNPTFHLSDEEIKINVTNFDDKCLVRSNDTLNAIRFLRNDKRREAIEEIFNQGFLFIKADEESISIKKAFDEEDLKAERLRMYLDALNKFALGSWG